MAGDKTGRDVTTVGSTEPPCGTCSALSGRSSCSGARVTALGAGKSSGVWAEITHHQIVHGCPGGASSNKSMLSGPGGWAGCLKPTYLGKRHVQDVCVCGWVDGWM